jgi:competence ComEA-like helix-hairpin-helix protein
MTFWNPLKKLAPKKELLPYYLNTNIILWLLLAVLVGLSLWRYYNNRVFVSRDFEFQTVETARLPDTINPNDASWPSLARLPGLGESKAKAIVKYREDWLANHPAGPPAFEKPDDLARVKGLGPATVEKLKPFLRFTATDEPEESQ